MTACSALMKDEPARLPAGDDGHRLHRRTSMANDPDDDQASPTLHVYLYRGSAPMGTDLMGRPGLVGFDNLSGSMA